jgi:hypothetical protein
LRGAGVDGCAACFRLPELQELSLLVAKDPATSLPWAALVSRLRALRLLTVASSLMWPTASQDLPLSPKSARAAFQAAVAAEERKVGRHPIAMFPAPVHRASALVVALCCCRTAERARAANIAAPG